MLVKWTERLIQKINTDPEIRPYLKYFPFNEKHVRIDILAVINGAITLVVIVCIYPVLVKGHMYYMEDRGNNEPFKKLH